MWDSSEVAWARADTESAACNTTTFPAARFRRRIELSLRGGGFDMNSVHRLLVTFGRRNYIESVPMSLFLAFDESEPNRDPQ